MKRNIFGIICIMLCLCLLISSCGKEETTSEGSDNTDAEIAEDTPAIPEEEVKETFEYTLKDGEATLDKYNGTDGEVTLEETVIKIKKKKEKKTVTETVENADGTKSEVEKTVEETVEVPEEYTLTAISAGAFMGNENLKKVIIPDSVLTVGDAAFQGCTALEEVVLPKGLEKISDRLFYGCEKLEKLEIPETVTTVGLFAFGDIFNPSAWYTNLADEDVIVGDGILIKHNGEKETVSYSDEVKKVAYYAFYGTPVKEVYFTNSVEDISDLAFYRTEATVMFPAGSSKISEFKTKGFMIDTYTPGEAE